MAESGKKTSRSRDSIANTLIVAIGVSLLCSILVSVAAVVLKPQQLRNQELYRQKIILEVAGLYEQDAAVDALFANVEARVVDLATGDYVDDIDATSFDALAASKDTQLGVPVPAEQDIAGLKRRARYATVYLVRENERIAQVILPVYGSGLWSTMHGYLALDADGNTVRGLRFFEHAETPGLGDQVDKPDWRAQWAGKQLFDASGELRIEVVRGQVVEGSAAQHQIDGLAGATLTGRGVSNLVRYWMGSDAFGPYLEKLAAEGATDG